MLDCIGVLAARVGRDDMLAEREVFDFVVRIFDVAAREIDVLDAARVGIDVRALGRRDDVLAGARDVTVAVLDVRGLEVVRETAVLIFWRMTEFSLRTAALTMPTLTMYVMIKIPILFIP